MSFSEKGSYVTAVLAGNDTFLTENITQDRKKLNGFFFHILHEVYIYKQKGKGYRKT